MKIGRCSKYIDLEKKNPPTIPSIANMTPRIIKQIKNSGPSSTLLLLLLLLLKDKVPPISGLYSDFVGIRLKPMRDICHTQTQPRKQERQSVTLNKKRKKKGKERREKTRGEHHGYGC